MSFRQLTRKDRQIRLLILAISVVCLTAGLLRQEPLRVLQRAIQICLGCIGIG
ncbi:MAG: CD1871A family CXXC motif-containing protein [Eubacteriales bacterium]|nr:CD1871A family CXXC motif-containing protein [Eubacteriales bacterium]